MNDARSPARRQARTEANRETIYRAAIVLFERRGFAATTMDEIAAEAGMARSSVFNHYPSKLAFLAEFFRRFTRDVIDAATRARLSGFANRLQALFAAIGPIAHANKAMVRAFASLAMGHGPLAQEESEADDEMLRFFREIVAEGQETGELRDDIEVGFLADLLLGLLTVTAHDWVNRGQSGFLQDELSARFDLLIQGLQRRPG